MNHCAWCCAENPLHKCSRCQSVHYCDQVCQKNHWILHRHYCGKPLKQHPLYYTKLEQLESFIQNLMDGLLAAGPLKDTILRNTIGYLGLEKDWEIFWSRYLEVRPSTVHENGVFAKRPLPASTIVTIYPAHLLITGSLEVFELCGDECCYDRSLENITYVCNYYGYDLSPSVKIVGLPSQYENTKFVGHLVNDSCQCDPFAGVPEQQLHSLNTLSTILREFYENIFKHVNCAYVFDKDHMMCAIMTTRPVSQDEELLVHYGLPYWLEKNYGRGYLQNNPYFEKAMASLYKSDTRFRRAVDDCMTLLKGHVLAMHV